MNRLVLTLLLSAYLATDSIVYAPTTPFYQYIKPMEGSPEYQLLRLIRTHPAVVVQNILMASPTRELAMSLIPLGSHEREEFLAFLSAAKRQSVEEELVLQRRLHIEPSRRRQMAESLLRRFKGERGAPPRSYLRPRGPRRG